MSEQVKRTEDILGGEIILGDTALVNIFISNREVIVKDFKILMKLKHPKLINTCFHLIW